MAEDENMCEWEGASGKKYKFWWYKLPHSFKSQDGNYIYTKIINNQYVPVYIGEGDLKDRSENHHKTSCIKQKGATYIHAHLKDKKKDRRIEEKDLLSAYPDAYEPTGCNEKEGG